MYSAYEITFEKVLARIAQNRRKTKWVEAKSKLHPLYLGLIQDTISHNDQLPFDDHFGLQWLQVSIFSKTY